MGRPLADRAAMAACCLRSRFGAGSRLLLIASSVVPVVPLGLVAAPLRSGWARSGMISSSNEAASGRLPCYGAKR
jgi:hypothetical protein